MVELTRKQHWVEAVVESMSDSAERERLIRLYDYDELVQACLDLALRALDSGQREAKLVKAIEDAPHSDHCGAPSSSGAEVYPCTCWKAEALREYDQRGAAVSTQPTGEASPELERRQSVPHPSPPPQVTTTNAETATELAAAPAAAGDLDALVKLLLLQLPDGMKGCTILFKECEKGHGWLTATNWVQHECQQCKIERLVREREETMTQIPQLLRDATRLMQQRAEAAERDAELYRRHRRGDEE